MNKLVLPYGLSLQLKEIGFNEPCIMQWTYASELIFCTGNWGHPKFKTNQESNSDSSGDCISAPSFYQANIWFLEKHKLYAVIIPTITMYWTYKTMTVVQDSIEVPPYNHVHAFDYSTREEAEIACINEMIQQIKNKIKE